MKKYLPHILFIASIISAQPTFTDHTISTSADGARSVYAADVDGDGDAEIGLIDFYTIISRFDKHKMILYKN